jgi:2-keto-4-pentenoate hydratase/2-oxohepta-3-ene-1,7-dioic acid hydratase in catechol pathway
MRIAAYSHAGLPHLGLFGERGVRPLPDDLGILGLLAAGQAGRAAAAAAAGDEIPLAEVRLLPPLQPASMRDFVSFEAHVEGVRRSVEGQDGVPESWYEQPTFLFMSPHSVIGANDLVPVPAGCTLLDYELEVAAVIGQDGRDLTPEQAAEHIAGYTILNDWSARDLQSREMRSGLGPAKGKDFASTLGPCVVTADELARYQSGDRLDLEMTVLVNSVRMGGDRLASMAWSFPELVAYASRSAWVKAGDVIASGTCAGGALAEAWGRNGRAGRPDSLDPPPLKPGDVVTMIVEGIGTISNEVVEGPPEACPIPRARRRDQR